MDDLRREFRAAWARFQTLDSLRLVPDTLESEWTRGRETYLAFLALVSDSAVIDYLRRIVRGIESVPGVEPYPEDYWHITFKGIGFEVETPSQPEDVAAAGVEGIAEAAREVFAAQPAFSMRIGLAGLFPEVVFAEVWDSLPVRELNCRLLEAMPGLTRYSFDGPNFLPHVSLARFTSDEGLPRLKEALARLRDEEPGPAFTIREVQFIRARLSERAPAFETIESYPFASGA